LAEGFLFYLPDEAIRRLLEQVSALSSSGSCLGFDIPNRAVLAHPFMRTWLQMEAEAGAPWSGTMERPAEHLAALGWRASLTQCGGADADYGRWKYPVVPIAAPGLPHHWLVTAKREPTKNSTGISGRPELDEVKEVR
jgi:O-methyltransferase involved in polyketide biosynthesis